MPDREDVHLTVSVVVPVFNEVQTLPEVIQRLLALPCVSEVVVVDDGSQPGIEPVLTTILHDQRITLLRHEANQGKGAALRTGFEAAASAFVVVQDADLEYAPEEIPRLIRPLIQGDGDVTYGSRFLDNGGKNVGPSYRVVANRVLTWISNRMTGLKLSDMETGHKAFRREVLASFTIEESRFGVEPEITAKVAKHGWRVTEIPVSYHPRSYAEGKKIGWRDGMRALWCIFRYC